MRSLWSTYGIVVAALTGLLGIPMLMRPDQPVDSGSGMRLVIITPHNEQIRFEFARGFDEWHRARFGQGVTIDWRTPGGTTEIRRQLIAEYESAAREGRMDTMNYDLLFGGGSFEHAQSAQPRKVLRRSVHGTADSSQVTFTISKAVHFKAEVLHHWYGENRIGRNYLYDPNMHWFGTALSGFGICFNRDLFDRAGLPYPQTWDDLTIPELHGLIALADPTRSGSVSTIFEVVLQREGWDRGWRTLQAAAANSRYFADSASKVVIDVGAGEAAAGMCIDFYGRQQAQALSDGGSDRLAYVDPPELSDIDPDPISLLSGAPHEELAIRFIEFCLSEEGQAIWQFRRRDGAAGFGPIRFEVRRMPVRRVMYERYLDHMIDPVNPFDLARPIDRWDSSFRVVLPVLFSAMAIDNHDGLRRAWSAIHGAALSDTRKRALLARLHSFPSIKQSDGSERTIGDGDSAAVIRDRWREDPGLRDRDRIAWTTYYRNLYRDLVRLVETEETE